MIGATNANFLLSTPSAAQAGNYTVLISDSIGSVTSVPATLTVIPPTLPEILVQPQSQTIQEGAEVTFGVVATNYLPLSFQWQFDSMNLPGTTQAVLTLPSAHASDAGPYRAVVSSEFLSVTSAVALLSIKPVEFVPGPGVVTNLDQASLEAALALGAPVTFGINGTIALTNAIVISTNTMLDASGRSITLDGQSAVRHFVVTNGATLRLVNLKLLNGQYIGAQGQTGQTGEAGCGGSIYISGGNLELMGCRFFNNDVFGGGGGPPRSTNGVSFSTTGGIAYGGAIFSSDGQISATNCLFLNNTSTGGLGVQGDSFDAPGGGDAFGGAIYSTNGGLNLIGVTLSNNVATGRPDVTDAGAHGGAVAAIETVAVVSNCVFAVNQAVGSVKYSIPGTPTFADAEGGGYFHGSGVLSVLGSHFVANRVEGGPGGIWRSSDGGVGADGKGAALFIQAGSARVRESAFTGNQAQGGPGYPFMGFGLGGGIYNRGSLEAINCTFAENLAQGGDSIGGFNGASQPGSAYGGAIFNDGNASLLNVTIARNSVAFGQPVEAEPPAPAFGSSMVSTNGTASVTNCILFCTASQTNVLGAVIDGGHNLCSDASAGFSSSTSHNGVDPLLGPLADNGGLTPTVALMPGSPAVDAGDDGVCPPTDQRGVTRPQGLACDIGAFELAPKLTLTRAPEGIVTLDYTFRAGQTNQITGSTNLINWLPLATRVSDTNGVFEFEDPDSTRLPCRFYQVQPQIAK